MSVQMEFMTVTQMLHARITPVHLVVLVIMAILEMENLAQVRNFFLSFLSHD